MADPPHSCSTAARMYRSGDSSMEITLPDLEWDGIVFVSFGFQILGPKCSVFSVAHSGLNVITLFGAGLFRARYYGGVGACY